MSLLGTWMQTTALAFLVYELTRSPAYLGYVGFATGVPAWLFTLYAGVVSDRVPRRTLLVVTQASMMLLAAGLAAVTFAGVVRPVHLIVFAVLLGFANAFDAPARQAFVSELVDRADLTNAIAMNSTMFNTAQAVGPAAAGIAYELAGPGWCFTINAVSFLAVIAALLAMRFDRRPPKPESTSARAELAEALRYAMGHREVRALGTLVAMTSLLGLSLVTLLPAWAVEVLHGTARTNGLLQSARGIGALAFALGLAALGHLVPRGRLLTIGSYALPLAMLAFATGRTLPVALVTLGAAGGALILVSNLCNALVQTAVPDEMRGRIMGIYTMVFFGAMPLGSLAVGSFAERAGEPAAVVTAAVALLVVAVVAWTRFPELRALE